MANTDRRYAIQDIENQGADRSFEGFPMRETVGYDGIALQRSLADSMAIKITEVGDVTYIALAAPGTSNSEMASTETRPNYRDYNYVRWWDC